MYRNQNSMLADTPSSGIVVGIRKENIVSEHHKHTTDTDLTSSI